MKHWCLEHFGGWQVDTNASFVPLDKIARDVRQALLGSEYDQRFEFDIVSLMLDGQARLGSQLALGAGPSFGQFWQSMPQSDAATVEVFAFVRKWASLAEKPSTSQGLVRIAAYVDVDGDGSVSPQEALNWVHALNFLWLFVRSPNPGLLKAVDHWCPGEHYGFRCRPESRAGASHCCITGAEALPDWIPDPMYTSLPMMSKDAKPQTALF